MSQNKETPPGVSSGGRPNPLSTGNRDVTDEVRIPAPVSRGVELAGCAR